MRLRYSMKVMNLEQALYKLALRIHDYCQPDSIYCIIPSQKESRLAHYIIYNELGATHYQRDWLEVGKSVKLTFFKSKLYAPTDSLGSPDFEKIIILKNHENINIG